MTGGEVQVPQDHPLATTLPALVTCDLGRVFNSVPAKVHVSA